MQQIVASTAADADLALIEGAMGFYDGIGQTSEASAYTVSQSLQTPVLLLVSPQGMGCSVAALCKGYLSFRTPNQIRGICLTKLKAGCIPIIVKLSSVKPAFPYMDICLICRRCIWKAAIWD